MDSASVKHRHYTPLEKKIFLDILANYKNIESKKEDTASLKEKEAVWKEIADTYNNFHSITQERTVQQLKKLWSNLKQTQRNAITKERQIRMATGGGPAPKEMDIDPDVENIVPNLMATVPTIFSSNMSAEELAGPMPPKQSYFEKINLKSELALKRERIERLMKYDEDLASVRLDAEREMTQLQVNHLKVIHALEVRAAAAKAELQEFLLRKKMNES